jgi:hypothetical protein
MYIIAFRNYKLTFMLLQKLTIYSNFCKYKLVISCRYFLLIEEREFSAGFFASWRLASRAVLYNWEVAVRTASDYKQAEKIITRSIFILDIEVLNYLLLISYRDFLSGQLTLI